MSDTSAMQFDLLEPRARATNPQTSRIAADRARTFAGEHHRRILDGLREHPDGGIKDQIAQGTGLDHAAVARRMGELMGAGKVIRTGETRRTRTGRPAYVWRIAQEVHR